jgi:hypothetical protein
MSRTLAFIKGLTEGALRRRAKAVYSSPERFATEADDDAHTLGYVIGVTVFHPLSSRDPQFKSRRDERAYEAAMIEMERDHDEEVRTGYRVCPKCGLRKVKASSRYTRQYGGGYDTFEKCENPACDYAEVWT